MAQREEISLHDSLPSDASDHGSSTFEDAVDTTQSDARHWESKWNRARALFGSSILQLPIWGFAMNYGVFQEYYTSNWTLQGSRDTTGIIGTTSNGVMYLSMPFLFALFARRWSHRRRAAAIFGAVLTCVSLLLSSFSTNVWHLVLTQGIFSALGCALIYSPTTLTLGEWFSTGNRAVAYGVTLSSKNIVGSAGPFMLRALLDNYGFRTALKAWMAIAGVTGLLGIFLIPSHPMNVNPSVQRPRSIPWQFLRHQTFYIYSIAIMLQSSGYGIPQTYLNTYAHDVAKLSQTSATLLLTLFNIPGIVSSSFFGYLSDGKRFSLSAPAATAMSAISTALSAFLFWGLTTEGNMALLVLFSMTFGFFAGGYSGTWGGIINQLERESAERNEAIDSGMVYGLLNGARGIGYVSGGLVGLPLLKVKNAISAGGFGYGTNYGPLILFTGFSTLFGGLGILWKAAALIRFVSRMQSKVRKWCSRTI